ncbi:MAG: M48 family metalloprotease, partial [Thermoplasmata archaeon]|nr:M48 family metalloprotease [Thermoplasmata archaeon]
MDLGTPISSFSISTEIAKSSLLTFPKFLMDSSSSGRFGQIAAGNFNQIAGEHGKFLIFDAKWYAKDYSATVRIKLDSPLLVEIYSDRREERGFSRRLEDYLILALQAYEEAIRNETIYMTFMPGSEKTSKLNIHKKLSDRVLTGNMVNLFLIAIIISVVMILIFGDIAPIILLVTILAIVLSAGKITALTSDWRITKEHPDVVIIECRLPQTLLGSFMQTYGSSLQTLKKNIYEYMTEHRRDVTSAEVADLFRKFGITVEAENIVVKHINVYDSVKKVAAKFEMPMPTIMITRNSKPNAAATGFTKHLATMLITIGLLIQLDKREIELVVGHELSHLRFGDPVILFSIFSIEYLARVYVYSALIASFALIYIFFIFWLVFFFAKF